MANNSMLMPLQIERQYGASLDADYAFDTLDELKNYATQSALSYSGQILYCKENDTLYKVNSDKTDATVVGGASEENSIIIPKSDFENKPYLFIGDVEGVLTRITISDGMGNTIIIHTSGGYYSDFSIYRIKNNPNFPNFTKVYYAGSQRIFAVKNDNADTVLVEGTTNAKAWENVEENSFWSNTYDIKGIIDIDDKLDADSINPVQNKIITEKFNELKEKELFGIDNSLILEGTLSGTRSTVTITIEDVIEVYNNNTSKQVGNWVLNKVTSNVENISNTLVNFNNSCTKIANTSNDSVRINSIDGNKINLEDTGGTLGSFKITLKWISSNGDSSITLTQEEYDALTDEEKNNGITYFISDADTDLTIDEEVNEESVNLVTNKAVATAIKEQINDTQVVTDKTYSSAKIESLINDTTYAPDMYDRNANGDMPVVPFDRLANNMFLIQNQALIKEGETYDEDYVGGWVYTSANDTLVQKQEMFNKIKCIVAIPGVLRIGIMNEHLWDANPRYSTCLVKWLVSDFVAYTGLKEYDIEDTILEEGQYLFIECRAGESSWYYNSSTEAVKIGDVTYPASSCTSGLNVADKLDSTTNNVVFKSQSVTSTSARTYFGNGQYNTGSKYRTNFLDRHCTSTARTPVTSQQQSLYQGGLNVGLYRRTKYSDTRFCKCVENGMNISWVGDDNVTKIYAAIGQEEIVGKSVYAFKLDVNTPGNLTIYHLKGKSLDTIEIIDKYTHYVRAKGLQTIHLPFDIKLESEDEYIGFGGLHFKSTSDNIVRHGCKWQYMAGDQTTGSCGWMNTIGKTGFYSIGVSMTSYPETFTSFETNGSYLNIELICRGEKRSPLEDKYISFTGDSITTFANFVTTQAGYPKGNTAGDNAYYYPASGKVINNVDATWWGILARDNRMQILRNDAWSGSRVSSATGSTDTKCLCGTERRYYLRNTYEPTATTTYPFGIPEIVVNMIGTNDLSGNVELGAEMFKGVTGAEDEYKTILSAYSLMCRRFAAEYNKNGAKVVHFIIPRGSDWGYANSNGVTIADLSLAFERIAKAWGQYFIPLSYFTGFNPAQYKKNTCPTASVHRNFRGTEFSSADGLHPNVVGMEILADGVDRFLKEIV